MKITDAAGWKKLTKNGGTYLSIKITYEDGTSAWVNLFENKYKNLERHPDMKTIKEKVEQNPEVQEPPFGLDDSEKIPF